MGGGERGGDGGGDREARGGFSSGFFEFLSSTKTNGSKKPFSNFNLEAKIEDLL